MKDILWLSHLVPYPPKGGVLQRSYNLIKEVSKIHNITLVAFNQKNLCSTPEQLAVAKEHLSAFCDVHEIVDIESDQSSYSKALLLMRGALPWNTYTLSWLHSDPFKRALTNLLNKRSFDVVHADTISLAPYALDLSIPRKVLNHHNIESLMMLRRANNEQKVANKFYFYQEGTKLKRYEASICRKFDLNVSCSSLDTERLQRICPDSRCVDVPNGVDLRYFTPSAKEADTESIIFAGGLSWYPNLDAMDFFLREVWPILCDEVPKIKMTVVGRSPPAWMRSLQARYPNLSVPGFVDDVRPYLDKSFIYVCPIRDGGGTKLKVLDALAMGKLLIAHPVACEGIDVQDGRDVVYAESPSDYVEAIKNVLQNPERARHIAENGQALVKRKYSFSEIGTKLVREYEAL